MRLLCFRRDGLLPKYAPGAPHVCTIIAKRANSAFKNGLPPSSQAGASGKPLDCRRNVTGGLHGEIVPGVLEHDEQAAADGGGYVTFDPAGRRERIVGTGQHEDRDIDEFQAIRKVVRDALFDRAFRDRASYASPPVESARSFRANQKPRAPSLGTWP